MVRRLFVLLLTVTVTVTVTTIVSVSIGSRAVAAAAVAAAASDKGNLSLSLVHSVSSPSTSTSYSYSSTTSASASTWPDVLMAASMTMPTVGNVKTPSAAALALSSGAAATSSLSYYVRVGLAGGLAGAVGTAVLYPVDVAKTLRQSQPAKYPSVQRALVDLLLLRSTLTPTSNSNSINMLQQQQNAAATENLLSAAKSSSSAAAASSSATTIQFGRVYSGVLPSVLGAIPSSALYFGAYESMKHLMTIYIPCFSLDQQEQHVASRFAVHALSALSGNLASSLVFVPKELIKQQMQTTGTRKVLETIATIVRQRGLAGLYCGYQATVMRNVPSAMLRFILYEELKRAWYSTSTSTKTTSTSSSSAATTFSWKLFAAGAVAGALASAVMTPMDVLKTRFSTGTCAVDEGMSACVQHVLQTQGWPALYAGAGSRMVWSGAFSAIGFATFEAAKSFLGVQDQHHSNNPRTTTTTTTRSTPTTVVFSPRMDETTTSRGGIQQHSFSPRTLSSAIARRKSQPVLLAKLLPQLFQPPRRHRFLALVATKQTTHTDNYGSDLEHIQQDF